MTTVYLVRHGQTEWNATKRAQGQADIALDARGREQALRAAWEFTKIRVDGVYSSDMKRTIATAQPIAESHSVTLRTDPAFREIDQGEWEGLTVDEIRDRWPERWGPARHYSARPGGETPQEVRARALDGLRRVVEEHPNGTVVVVSHGGTIRWLAAEALGYDDRRSALIRGLGNGQMVKIDAHLKDGDLILNNLVRLDGATPDLDDPND